MRSFVFPLHRLVPLILFLLVSAPVWSQNSGDRGQWQIVQARYGSAQQNIDVTQRVRELVRSDTAFRVTNDLFGRDPHPNVAKTLRIEARGTSGARRTFAYAENQFVQGTLFTGSTGGNWSQSGGQSGWDNQGSNRPAGSAEWQILQARYGTAQRSKDVTQQVRDLARRQGSFQVGNDQFGGDPHPGVEKTLRIEARGPGGATRTFAYAENQFVQGAQFTGSTGGNWGQSGGQSGGQNSWNSQGSNPPASTAEGQIVQARYGTAERSMDVTQQVRGLASRHSSFRVNNDRFGGDPHPGAVKTLRIEVREPGGATRTLEYPEDHVVPANLLAGGGGWGGMNWGRDGADSGL